MSLFPDVIENEKCQKLFAFEHGVNKEDYKFMRIKSSSLGKLAYILPEEKVQWINQKFRAPELYTSRELCLNFVLQNPAMNVLLLNIHQESMELVIKTKNNIQFHNHFKVNSTEDILYYSLYALEQLDIEKELLNCYIAGNLSGTEFNIEEIQKFIKTELVFQRDNHGSPNLLNHKYFSSIQMLLCE